jgi:hypothetical protein
MLMTANLQELNQFDQLEGYKILNTLIPEYYKTKYPYDTLTSDKVVFTKKKIEIIAKEMSNKETLDKPQNYKLNNTGKNKLKNYSKDMDSKCTTNKDNITGGVHSDHGIIVYG